jgi:hypothetical protein
MPVKSDVEYTLISNVDKLKVPNEYEALTGKLYLLPLQLATFGLPTLSGGYSVLVEAVPRDPKI